MAGAIVRTNPNRKTTTSTGSGGTKKTYDSNADYQSLINEAVKNNDYASAAQYEQLRNQKIIGEGLNYDTTSKYISHLNGWDSGGTSSGGGNSQYTGSNVGTNTGSNSGNVYATDYQSLINDAVNNKDFYAAAMYEQLRNQKIDDLGLDYDKTYLYSGALNNQTSQQNQQDSLYAMMQYMQNWQQQNQQPTQKESDPRIDEMLTQILNRDKFSYNPENDPLYQQYLQTAQREGDRAMRETLAEAASSAGGMNSFAITAAQQANNYYNSQLNDRIPELYQLSYEKYLKDIDNQIRDLGLLQSMDETQYNRYRDTMSDWYNDKNFAYGMYADAINQGNWQTNFDYNSMWDNINYNTNNYWKDKEWDYNDVWKNKEWDANQSQLELDNSRTDQATAREDVWQYISMGVMPSADLIAKAGMDEATVKLAVQAAIAEQTKTTSKSSGGGGGSKGSYSGGNGYDGGIDDDVKLTDEGDGSVIGLGIGPVSNDMLEKLAKAGAIVGDDNGNLYWADGWNRSNYQNKLENAYGFNNSLAWLMK